MAKGKKLKEPNSLRLERLLKRHEQTLSNKFYAVQRFDLLTISVSGAGIYIIFEVLKFLKTQQLNTNLIALLKLSGIIFTISIIVNFLSQFSSWSANHNEELCVDREIKRENGEDVDKREIDRLDRKVIRFNGITRALNLISSSFMIGGVILLVIYSFANL
jgi:hypothetical protein